MVKEEAVEALEGHRGRRLWTLFVGRVKIRWYNNIWMTTVDCVNGFKFGVARVSGAD